MKEAQIALEKGMLSSGVERYNRSIREAEENGRGEDTTYATAALLQIIQPAAENIDKYAKAVPKALASKVIEQLSPEVCAIIAVRCMFSVLTRKSHSFDTVSRTSLAADIGKTVHLEMKLRALFKKNKKYTGAVIKSWKSRGTTSVRHKDNATSKLLKLESLTWDNWPVEIRVNIGVVLIETILQSCELFEYQRHSDGRKSKLSVVLTAEALGWIEKHKEFFSLLNPQYGPMVIPPNNWDAKQRPYCTKEVNSTITFVRNKYRKQKISPHSVPQKVYDAVNAVQSTPWVINPAVLQFAREMQRLDIQPLVPPAGNTVPPECPLTGDKKAKDLSPAQAEAFREWKSTARSIHNQNASERSSRIRFNQVLELADTYSKHSEIYFPHNVDSRGRMYPIPTILTPQGDDLSKGLLDFKHREPLTPLGVVHLELQLANKYGVDKESHVERLAWVEAHKDTILKMVESPVDYLEFVRGASSPYQFFAAATHYHAYTKDPTTPLPARANKDGSCNGLQHFAALLRDADLANSVNLTNTGTAGDAPESVYKVIAREVQSRLTNSPDPLANAWLRFFKGTVDYKCMKRPVMTLPYSATMYSRREYVREYVLDNGGRDFFGEGLTSAVNFLAEELTRAMEVRVGAAIKILDWMHAVTKIVLAEHGRVTWKSPLGFPVITCKTKYRAKVFHMLYLGRGIKIRLRDATEDTDNRKVMAAVVPNFVHSMDAAHLSMAVLELDGKPVHVVHDDFGVHVNHASTLVSILTRTFKEMYSEVDIHFFADQQPGDLPPVPEIGDFNIEDVASSRYAFD